MKTMLEFPNSFDYATSELSQDAFLCWLASWSDSQYRNNSVKEYTPNSY